MPAPAFFYQFGIFSTYGFLSETHCQKTRYAMDRSRSMDGAVWNPHDGHHIREEVKKRKEFVGVPVEIESEITASLRRLIPELSTHFLVELKDVQPLKFTRYDEGDYYRMHRDVSVESDGPAMLDERKVAITIFLNEEGDDFIEGDYEGGNLTFYGLVDDPVWHGVGLPLESEAGLLVAFRPDTIHEVTPVTHGSRYAITTWFI